MVISSLSGLQLGGRLVAVAWLSGMTSGSISGAYENQVPLLGLGLAERMRRFVGRWYIDYLSPTSAVTSTWLYYGVISLIEVTRGGPPPTPSPISAGLFSSRDIVWSDFQTLGNPNVLTGRYRVPGDGRAGEIDTEVSRGDGVDPLEVWWNWGVAPGHGLTTGDGYYRMWWRVLVDTV